MTERGTGVCCRGNRDVVMVTDTVATVTVVYCRSRGGKIEILRTAHMGGRVSRVVSGTVKEQ